MRFLKSDVKGLFISESDGKIENKLDKKRLRKKRWNRKKLSFVSFRVDNISRFFYKKHLLRREHYRNRKKPFYFRLDTRNIKIRQRKMNKKFVSIRLTKLFFITLTHRQFRKLGLKSKAESLKQKEKLETNINELELRLDNSNKINGELQKLVKKLQTTVNQLNASNEEQQRAKNEAVATVAQAERRANLLSIELEELDQTKELAEKSKKTIENELQEAADRIIELNSSNAILTAHKRKIDRDLVLFQVDLEETIAETKISEERAKQASSDAARLAEELRLEQVLKFGK